MAPGASVGRPVTLKAEISGATLGLSIEATLITPTMEAQPVTLKGRVHEWGLADGILIGHFTPAQPGRYELNVLVRDRSGGTELSVRKKQTFQIRRGDGIALAEGGAALDMGDLYPGETARLTAHPEFRTARGRTLKANVTLPQGPGEARIDADAITVSPETLGREGPHDAFQIEIKVPVDQAVGSYSGSLRVWSEYDECSLPLRINVAPPGLLATPAVLALGKILPGRTGQATLTVSLAGGGRQPVHVTLQPWISQGSREGPGFYVEGLTRSFVLAGGSSEAIKVTVRVPEGAPAGKYRSALMIRTPLADLRVPVAARVVRPPMALRTITIVALAVAAGALLLLCLWDLYRAACGRPSSLMRRYLAISALAHAAALLASALILVGPDARVAEQRVAVRAVRIRGDQGLAGGADRLAEKMLRELARLDEQASRLELAMADDKQQRQQKDQAEPQQLAELRSETRLHPAERKEQAEIVQEPAELAKAPDIPSESPDVTDPELHEKRADEEQKPAEAQTVDLAAAAAEETAPKQAVQAVSMTEPRARQVAPERAKVSTRPRARRMAVRALPEVSAPTVPLPASPRIRQKIQAATRPEEPDQQITLAPPGVQKAAPTPALRPAAVQPLPARRVTVPRTRATVTAQAQPVAYRPQPGVSRPERPRELRLPAVGVPQPGHAAARPDKPEPEEPKPLAVPLAMAAADRPQRPGMHMPGTSALLPAPRSLSPVPPPHGRRGSSAPFPVGAAPGRGSKAVGLGNQVSAGKVVVGTAQYDGDWGCDKTAMPNLAYQLERRVGLAVETETRSVKLSAPDIFQCAFLFLSGHRDFQFRLAEIRQLQRYLRAGGALWVNDSTHEGDTTFDTAVRRELSRLLPGSHLEPIPLDAPIFNACYDLRRGYKGYAIPPGDKYRESRLHGVRIAGRWAVIYSRNDYGDGLEIDPNTHPLMKSLTNLSPGEMQEGSIRMGMNLAFYILSSAQGAGDADKLKLAHMQRTAAAAPEAEERSRGMLAGRQLLPVFQSLEPQEEWNVAEGWSRDKTDISVNQAGRISLSLTRGQDGKNVVGRLVEGDLSGFHWLVLEVESKMTSGARLAVGLTTGTAYFESAPQYVRPGQNPGIVFDLTAATFKTEATAWKYTAKARDLNDVRAIHLLFYPISSGTAAVRSIRLAR